ncbi:MAG: aminotransferase class V-fold PLP-dependent enzyme [Betaproteobacteria bacterium]|nr:aminotransferase class V-fold PLP-dependent enzyme [Betaproteobacteria bacterium]
MGESPLKALATQGAGRIVGRRLLHSPGPTPVPDEVLWAMNRQPMDLGDPRVDSSIKACETGLRRLLQTEAADVFLYASNGHGVWEAVVENLLPLGGTALVPGTGHFSESWAVQTEALGRRVLRTPWIEGLPIDVAAVAQALRQDHQHEIRAVFVVHTDTSSGVSTDLAALRAAIDATGHPALFVVDVVASLGAAPFAMDALRADVVLGASQKGLMCPPGIGFVAVNAAALAMASANPAPRFYWDWVRRKSDLSYRKFCGTAPQSLVAGLAAALGLLFQEGLDQVFERHRQLAQAVHAAVQGWSSAGALDFFARDPAARSVSVTTVLVPPGTDVDALRTVARERFQVAFAGALGPLSGRAFRIGHLGDQNPASMMGCLAGIEAALLVQGIPIGRDGLARASLALSQTPAVAGTELA